MSQRWRPPHRTAKVPFSLPEILLLLPCASLAGSGDLTESELWGGELHQSALPTWRLEPSIARRPLFRPARDTLGRVPPGLDPDLFVRRSTRRVEGLRDAEPNLVTTDGKARAAATTAEMGASPCT